MTLKEDNLITFTLLPGVTDVEKSPTSPDFEKVPESKHNWSPDSDEFDFGLEKAKQEVKEPEGDEEKNDWAKFQALTSGVDDIVKKKKEELDSLKVSSYYQRKLTQDEIEEDARLARPKNLVGKRKKQWVDLDQEGFEEKEGVIGENVSDGDLSEEEEEEKDEADDEEFQFVEKEREPTPDEEKPTEEYEEAEKAEKEEEDEEEDIFNTEFVAETLAVLDLKLNEIPDSPIEEGPDVFDTKFASEIVEKAEKERARAEKAESDKIKFGCISAAADVLTGKASKVDKTAVELTVRKRSRRANRINLIGDDVNEVTAMEDTDGAKETESKEVNDLLESVGDLDIPVDDLLTTTPSPVVMSSNQNLESSSTQASCPVDLSEFDEPLNKENVALTSNIALLESELNEAPEKEEEEEEDDPFDAAFDELAKESLTKVTLEEITNDLFNDDLFDTTAADDVLNLASLTNVVNKKEEKEEEILDTFDDKDPFDTSAYDHITKDLEDDLEFESLAKRDPNETVTNVGDDLGEYNVRENKSLEKYVINTMINVNIEYLVFIIKII